MAIQTKIILTACLVIMTVFIVLWDRAGAQRNAESSTPVDLVNLNQIPADKAAGSAGTTGSGNEGAVSQANPTGDAAAKGNGESPTDLGPNTVVLNTPEVGTVDPGKGGAGNTRTALPGEGITPEGGTETHAGGNGGSHAGSTDRTPSAKPRTYVVKSGDSPWRIAEKVYGDGSQYRRILEANRDKVNAQGTNLKIGMELVVPEEAGATRVVDETPTPQDPDAGVTHSAETPAGPDGTTEYVIQAGDSLSKISQKFFGTSARWDDIYQANTDRLESPDDLHVGEAILIPSGR